MLRQARRTDIPAMHRVRTAVLENRLTTSIVTEADYIAALEHWGQGWVIDVDGDIAGFAIGNATDGNIWALFVDPRHEGRGHGRRLHDAVVNWLWSRGLQRLWLTTEPATRAQRFYEAAGWRCIGHTEKGELRFELPNPEGRSRFIGEPSAERCENRS
jgi:GNAT superfamily N-acetyltransferase